MRPRSAVLLAVALGLSAALASCDSVVDAFVPDTITFDGVEIETLGDASFRLENDRLVVTNIGTSGEDGIGLWQSVDSAYLTFEPIDLPTNGTFGISVRDTDNEFLASIFAKDNGGGRHDIVFDIAPSIGVQAVTLQYLLGGQVLVEIPNFPFLNKTLRAETNAGSADGKNGSTRVVRSGGRYVVGQDYGEDDTKAAGAGAPEASGGCRFAQISLPVRVGDLTSVCADLVQVVIEDADLPADIRGAAVTGSYIDRFVITSVTVDDQE
ncbi:hypothetical protein [Rubricoccus marinus]|uniref:DUF4382 domain-containing protein n=1 Tax=Rubricoccus marinus TaxID=716817 RepID=A0A259TVJ5_9BACT|nr:hypothetical protein [Rubricoccus marinus]OZC01604.1 hypothetical protein BSZ36_00560 [Rubricoccus marinus]